jgi:hypothetical protein
MGSDLRRDIDNKVSCLLQEVAHFTSAAQDQVGLHSDMVEELEAILHLPGLVHEPAWSEDERSLTAARYLADGLDGRVNRWGCLLGWWSVHSLGRVRGEDGFEARGRSWIDEWLLGKVLARTLQDLGLDEADTGRAMATVKALTSHQSWPMYAGLERPGQTLRVLESLLQDDAVQQLLQVNRYQDVLWFNKEAFEELMWWLMVTAYLRSAVVQKAAGASPHILTAFGIIEQMLRAAEGSEYKLERLLTLLREGANTPAQAPQAE